MEGQRLKVTGEKFSPSHQGEVPGAMSVAPENGWFRIRFVSIFFGDFLQGFACC